jgi:hypothetical protein
MPSLVNSITANKGIRQSAATLADAAGLALIALCSLGPLLFNALQATFYLPHATWQASWGSKLLVVLLLAGTIALRARIDRASEPWSLHLAIVLSLLAVLFAACHWVLVDRHLLPAEWQRETYLQILNHTADAPHNFRPLPYGFTRLLEWLTGDWWFSCVMYRWFFTYWYLWSCYRLARLFHSPARALATLTVFLVLYPLSIAHYWGQLTDPLGHMLFVLAFIYTLEDRLILLAGSLALGILAKETVVLMVPVYWACHWRGGLCTLGKAAFLGLVCTASFFAVRLPIGWQLDFDAINGTSGLMVRTNLGIGEPDYLTSVSLYQNYLHPLLFVGAFLPFIAARWGRLDRRLKTILVTLTPLLLTSNLCFGWMYESRNYMPLVPLLATMALPRKDPS